MDRDAQGLEAPLASELEPRRLAIIHPDAVGAETAGLAHDHDPISVSAPFPKRAGDETLSVPGLGIVETVRVRRVEPVHSARERPVNHADPVVFAEPRLNSQRHRPEADATQIPPNAPQRPKLHGDPRA